MGPSIKFAVVTAAEDPVDGAEDGPFIVKFAHVIIVLLAYSMTRLRFPTKGGEPTIVDRYWST